VTPVVFITFISPNCNWTPSCRGFVSGPSASGLARRCLLPARS